MAKESRHTSAFFALMRAGLWETGARLGEYAPVDWEAIYNLALEQSVAGIVAAGLERVEDIKVEKQDALRFVQKVIPLEKVNSDMNAFIADLAGKLNKAGVRAVLVKGQGVAQCYERPLWRMPGDVDLLLDSENYAKAKELLVPMATEVEKEHPKNLHQGLEFGKWVVELHGTYHANISKRSAAVLDRLQSETCSGGGTRIWRNDEEAILLPSPDNDVIFIFSHILQHFFFGGIGLRQICDWCRLLWTYRESIDRPMLESRLKEMGLTTEWKAFAALAVKWLGMPSEALPLYDTSARWERKARRIVKFILKVGNFGHNRDISYHKKYPFVIYKAISLARHTGDFFRYLAIFPLDSFGVFFRMLASGFETAAKGE